MSPLAFDRIVVAIAFTSADQSVLGFARLLHVTGGEPARFTFVHVRSDDDRTDPGRRTEREARMALEALAAATLGPDASVDFVVVDGPIVDRVLEITGETRAGLIMLGHRTSARGRRSFSRRIAMKAPCSVLLVPEGTEPGIRRVIAGVDFSTHSAQALGAAGRFAARFGVRQVTAIHVRTPTQIALDDVEREAVERDVTRFVEPIDLHGARASARVVESGSAASALVGEANQPGDLLVVGTRGRGTSASVLLGSESEHVLERAQCATLVTKERGARLGLLRALLDRDVTVG